MTDNDDRAGLPAAELAAEGRRIAALELSAQRLRSVLYSIGDAVIATDAEGRIAQMNPVAEHLTGWREEEAIGRHADDVFRIINEETRAKVESPIEKVLREGKVVGLANHTLLVSADGTEHPIADSGAPIRDRDGRMTGVVLVFRDQSAERQQEKLLSLRLELGRYAVDHTLDELLTRALDESGALVESPIGFYHFVSEDQQSLTLQQWSTRTLQEYCKANGHGLHYGIEQAGVWADCVHTRAPVIHNDYASLPNKKGLPEGHAPLIRELVVPVIHEGDVVAILGVGNKPTDYTDRDVQVISYLADVTWHLVQQKRTEEALREAEERFRVFFDNAPVGKCMTAPDGRLVRVNPEFGRILGYTLEEIQRINFAAITHPDDLAMSKECVRCLLAGEKDTWEMEKRYIAKDGSIVWTHVTTRLQRDEAGAPLFFLTHVQDITEQKLAQAALAESEENFRILFETMPIGWAEHKMLFDDEGEPADYIFLRVNAAFERFTGLTREVVVGKRVTELIPGIRDADPDLVAKYGEVV